MIDTMGDSRGDTCKLLVHPSSSLEMNAASGQASKDIIEAHKELIGQQDMRDMNADLIKSFQLTESMLKQWYLCGYLFKKSRRLGKWKRRFAIASKDGHFYSYKSHESLGTAEPTEKISFTLVTGINVCEDGETTNQNAFFIVFNEAKSRHREKERRFLFHTEESRQNLANWVNHLYALCSGTYDRFIERKFERIAQRQTLAEQSNLITSTVSTDEQFRVNLQGT